MRCHSAAGKIADWDESARVRRANEGRMTTETISPAMADATRNLGSMLGIIPSIFFLRPPFDLCPLPSALFLFFLHRPTDDSRAGDQADANHEQDDPRAHGNRGQILRQRQA